ncbi:RICIN domain-containing protein [Frankia sp. R82]|uniref:RICIN domain-containing protein n=1 Tax=Frankia sp. R82 TaxID=2950553 RepID=UPI002044BC00|nr:RICIN domain-containing protein [Frankia sp. R82]MCM3885198.1 RICIN domain-containing protein [Frankia sp. R82]
MAPPVSGPARSARGVVQPPSVDALPVTVRTDDAGPARVGPGGPGQPVDLPVSSGAALPAPMTPAAQPAAAPTQPQPQPQAPAAAQPAQPVGLSFADLATGLCLDSNGGQLAYTSDCNGSDHERWRVFGYGTVVLTNIATGYCLDSNAAGQAYTRVCQNKVNQQWRTVDTGDGTVTLTDVGTRRCLDSNGAGELYTSPCKTNRYQRWSARG